MHLILKVLANIFEDAKSNMLTHGLKEPTIIQHRISLDYWTSIFPGQFHLHHGLQSSHVHKGTIITAPLYGIEEHA